MAAVAQNSVVTLTYDLSVTDDNQQKVLVEQAESDEPMVFLFGHSGLPEEFERQLDGKNAGDQFSFSLTPEQAYGDYDEQAVVLEVGNYLPMADNEGHHMQAKVVEVGEEMVTMDFNHPLAGMVMHFEGKIESVRPATAEELSHGHVHGDGGHQH
jgi:FKBP-type peptidyl-prolyl cis-trans isomerase SlyD